MNKISVQLVLVMTFWTGLLFAGPGHDEGGARAATDAPKREPDGQVFLPKPSQRQLAVRTQIATETDARKTVLLQGRVVMDPNAGGKVQATVAGRIEPGPQGLPALGKVVKKGEVLAYVKPSTGTLERANQVAQAAELRSNLELAKKQLARVKELVGSVPQKQIDTAHAEVQSLTERLAAVGDSLNTTEALLAPVSGLISMSNVVAGQVVDARELVFEIVDPSSLYIEAVAHDASLTSNIAYASTSIDGGKTSIPLVFVGAGRVLREQMLPIQFRTQNDATVTALVVGQRVNVVVQTQETIRGLPVPAAAIVKSANNQDIVWVHTQAERFVPKTVRYIALDGTSITVVDGLKSGDRVVVQGASLVNQVR